MTLFGTAVLREPLRLAWERQSRTIPDLIPFGLLDMDPPERSRIRRLMAKAFTMRSAERLRPSAVRLAAELSKP
jgi:cytochrome P450